MSGIYGESGIYSDTKKAMEPTNDILSDITIEMSDMKKRLDEKIKNDNRCINHPCIPITIAMLSLISTILVATL